MYNARVHKFGSPYYAIRESYLPENIDSRLDRIHDVNKFSVNEYNKHLKSIVRSCAQIPIRCLEEFGIPERSIDIINQERALYIDDKFHDLAESVLSCHTFARIIGNYYASTIAYAKEDIKFLSVDVCDGVYMAGFQHSWLFIREEYEKKSCEYIIDVLPIGQSRPCAVLTNWNILGRDIPYKENRFLFANTNFIKRVSKQAQWFIDKINQEFVW